MITFIAFVLTIFGGINWLMIGFLQYDFIAGLFGFQASIFSRICYILFGVASVYLVLRTIVNKGTFKIFERKKKNSQAAAQPVASAQPTAAASQPTTATSQAPQNFLDEQSHLISYDGVRDFATIDSENFQRERDGLFDEHFKSGQN